MHDYLPLASIVGMAFALLIGVVIGQSTQLRRDAAASLKNDPFNYEWSIAVHRAQIDAQIAAERKGWTEFHGL